VFSASSSIHSHTLHHTRNTLSYKPSSYLYLLPFLFTIAHSLPPHSTSISQTNKQKDQSSWTCSCCGFTCLTIQSESHLIGCPSYRSKWIEKFHNVVLDIEVTDARLAILENAVSFHSKMVKNIFFWHSFIHNLLYIPNLRTCVHIDISPYITILSLVWKLFPALSLFPVMIIRIHVCSSIHNFICFFSLSLLNF
jgi:hypothetical protein